MFKYTLERDKDFRYPPFGDTYPEDIVDLDRLFTGSPALADGHLYTTSFDGQVYSFDLQNPVARTQKNLALLGSGLVPFVPAWTEPNGTFDRVWTDADWYKNQDGSTPTPTTSSPPACSPLGLPAAALAIWARRRIRDGGHLFPQRSRVDLRPPDLDHGVAMAVTPTRVPHGSTRPAPSPLEDTRAVHASRGGGSPSRSWS